MNRNLKFRAWSPRSKEFVYSDTFGHLGYGNNKQDDARKLCQFFDFSDKIQQFTGLLDKNGKEIYEGDILSLIGPDDFDNHDGIVIFKEGMFTISGNKFSSYPCLSVWNKCSEIKGNIFENPELLKQ